MSNLIRAVSAAKRDNFAPLSLVRGCRLGYNRRERFPLDGNSHFTERSFLMNWLKEHEIDSWILKAAFVLMLLFPAFYSPHTDV